MLLRSAEIKKYYENNGWCTSKHMVHAYKIISIKSKLLEVIYVNNSTASTKVIYSEETTINGEKC